MTNTLTAEQTDRKAAYDRLRLKLGKHDIYTDQDYDDLNLLLSGPIPSPPVSGEAAKLRVGQVWKTRGGWIASVFAKSPFPEYPFTVGHNKGDVLKNYSANHRADGQRLDVESDDDLVELLSSPSDDDARRYIENWCPDHVKDYIASLSPLTNEPVALKLLVDNEWLKDKISSDPDCEVEARSGGNEPVGVTISRDEIALIMTEEWNEICNDTSCHPLDITHGNGSKLFFKPSHWVDQIADRLSAAIGERK